MTNYLILTYISLVNSWLHKTNNIDYVTYITNFNYAAVKCKNDNENIYVCSIEDFQEKKINDVIKEIELLIKIKELGM